MTLVRGSINFLESNKCCASLVSPQPRIKSRVAGKLFFLCTLGPLWLSRPMTKLTDGPRGGSGMLAVFCDLAEEDQADFRPWLIEDMFPARLDIGFNACASFDRVSGDGPEFVTLYEMPSLGHLYGEPYQALRRVRNPRDAAYHEKFQNPERHTYAWAGPELSSEAGGFAPYIYVDRFELADEDAQAFNIWFVGSYLPALSELEGLLRMRRYVSMEGAPKHFVLHEFADGVVFENSDWMIVREQFGDATSALYQQIIHAP